MNARLKNVARIVAGQSPASDSVQDFVDGLPFIQGNAEFGKTSPSAKLECVAPPKQAQAGDVLISVRAPVGAVNVADRAYGIGRGLAAVRATRADGSYLRWFLESSATELKSRATGSTFEAISSDDLGTLRIPVADSSVQARIADFLDRETAKIDTLIEKQNALIERLRERRREVVSHAVRLGIEPRAPMKECGVPWIGMLPSHWSTPQLRRLVTMTSGVGFPVDEQGIDDELHPFYKVNALARADLDGVIRQKYDTISGATAERLGATIVPAGSLVLAKIGAALLLGRIRVLSFASCIDNNMLAVSPRHGVASRFLYYALQDVRMDLLVNPGAVPSLSEKWFRAYQIPFPPWGEQQEIADFLDRETAKIDSLIVKAERFVELARERRAALITAGVTGQLDVEGAA